MSAGRPPEMTSGSPTKKRLIKKPTPKPPKPKPETKHKLRSTRPAYAMVHMPVFEYLAQRSDAAQLGWLYTYLLARVHVGGDGWKISHAEMAEAMGKNVRTVQRNLDTLKRLGLIDWEPTFIYDTPGRGWNNYIVQEDWRPIHDSPVSPPGRLVSPPGDTDVTTPLTPASPPSRHQRHHPADSGVTTLPAPVSYTTDQTDQEQTNERPTTAGRRTAAAVVDSLGSGSGSSEAKVSRPVKPNKWDDTCIHCGKPVKAGEGRLVGRKVAHLEGTCPSNRRVGDADLAARSEDDYGLGEPAYLPEHLRTRSTTASIKTNTFPGKCLDCGKNVKAGAGRLLGKSPAHLEGQCPSTRPRNWIAREKPDGTPWTAEDYIL